MTGPEIHFRVPTDRALNPDDNVLDTGTCHVDVAVVIDPTMTLLGEHQRGFGGDTIRLKRWDEQVLLHELLHVAVSRSGWWNDPQRQIDDPNGHDVISRIEVALWETGWRLGGAEAVEAARAETAIWRDQADRAARALEERQAAERALVARIEAVLTSERFTYSDQYSQPAISTAAASAIRAALPSPVPEHREDCPAHPRFGGTAPYCRCAALALIDRDTEG